MPRALAEAVASATPTSAAAATTTDLERRPHAHPSHHERLLALRLTGMAKAFDDQLRQPDIDALAFEERLAS